MATNAIEARAQWQLIWGHLRKVSPERWEFTTRLALICALTTLVTEIYQTPEPALTAYVAFFLNRPARTLSLIMSAALTILISIVIGLIFLVAKAVADDPLWRVSSITLISFGLLFLASASKLRPVAGTIALIVGYALDLLGQVKVGEEATRVFLYAWLFVAIPAGVSLIVNLVLAPNPRRVAERALGLRLRLCAAFLRDPETPSVRQAFRESAETGVEDIREQLKLVGIEKSALTRDLGALQQAALSTAVLTGALEILEANPEVQLPATIRGSVAATLDEMANILKCGGYPVEVTSSWPTDGELNRASQRVLDEIGDALTHFAGPTGVIVTKPTAQSGFFAKDAFTNPEHVQFALKTTGAAVFCYTLYSLLDWPGIHTCFLTCYIVAQATAAESVEKLTLRIAGCLVGAAAGIAAIVFLVPSLTSIGGLLFAVFAGAWAAAYLAAGSPRISYAGFQMAFAFFLCVIQGAGPQFDLEVARDRIIGILIGNVVAYVAYVHIWPMTITRRIDPAIASVLSRLRELSLVDPGQDRRLIATEVTSTLAAARTDIALAHYEPVSIRAPDAWLRVRREVIEGCRALCPLLLLSKAQADLSGGIVAAHLDALSARFAGQQSVIADAPNTSIATGRDQTFSRLVEDQLGRLETTAGSLASDAEAAGHALA